MKNFLFISILFLFSGISWAEEKVTIAYFQCQPHIIYDSSTKKLSGALYTFLEKNIAPKMGVQFIWDEYPSNVPRQLKMLTNESRDAVCLLVFTPDRAKKFSFTKNRYTVMKAVIGVLNSNPLTKIDKVEDILHLKVGYAAKTYLSPFMRDKRINFEFVHTAKHNEQNLRKLKAKRVDAVYIPDKAVLLSEINHLHMEKMVRVIELPDPPGNAHVVFSKKNKALADKFDKAYYEIDGDKIYQELLSQYLDVDEL